MRFLLVHGGLHGAWCWTALSKALERHGVTATSIDLPGHGRRASETASPESYAEAVAAAVQPDDVIVGHSLGGLAITLGAAMAEAPIRRRIYLAAVVPADGEALQETVTLTDAGLADAIIPADNGAAYSLRDTPASRALLYGDCAEAVTRDAFARLTPQQLAPLTTPANFDADAVRAIPADYILCTRDMCLRPAIAERMAARLGVIPVRFEASHSPFLSRPDDLAELLVELAGDDGRRPPHRS